MYTLYLYDKTSKFINGNYVGVCNSERDVRLFAKSNLQPEQYLIAKNSGEDKYNTTDIKWECDSKGNFNRV